MKKSNITKTMPFLGAAALLCCASLHGAPITWGAATTLVDSTDVVTTGTLVCSPIPATSVIAAELPPKPNIVFILADDMGYGDLKAYNPQSKIATPNLDRLSAGGMTFTDAHAGGSTCIPSRYALLTGRFPIRGKSMNDSTGALIEEGRPTIASVLRDTGYRTAMVGKWHLGFDQNARKPGQAAQDYAFDYTRMTGGPADHGFNSFFGMHASLDIPPYFFIKDRAAVSAPTETVASSTSFGGPEGWNKIQGAFWRGGNIAPDFKHQEVTPRFVDEACKVIASHDGGKPLFLYLALPSPHTPWLPAAEFVGKSGAGMYGDFVMTVDNEVGRVLKALDQAGMTRNTLVLFSSDNGPVWYEKDVDRFGHASAGPLRGVKASVWEGGHRVPFIASWPPRIKAGTRSEGLVSFVDVFATFAELSGWKTDGKGAAEDSESFLPALLHPEQLHKARSPILHSDKVIRDGDWKLIATPGGRGFSADSKTQYGIELYNLRKDISETNNLYEKMPEKVEGLRVKIGQILGNTAHPK